MMELLLAWVIGIASFALLFRLGGIFYLRSADDVHPVMAILVLTGVVAALAGVLLAAPSMSLLIRYALVGAAIAPIISVFWLMILWVARTGFVRWLVRMYTRP